MGLPPHAGEGAGESVTFALMERVWQDRLKYWRSRLDGKVRADYGVKGWLVSYEHYVDNDRAPSYMQVEIALDDLSADEAAVLVELIGEVDRCAS